MTTEDWLKLVAQVGSAGVVVISVLKFSRDSKRVTDAIETSERVGPLVEGDPKQHTDQLKRDGLLGRVADIEHREKATKNVQEVQTKAIEGAYRRIRAILRGLNLPSDISDDGRLEKEIKKKVVAVRYPIDRLGAALEMVDPHETTGSHRAAVAERVPRPEPRKMPALQGRRDSDLRDSRPYDERRDSYHGDPRRDPTDPPPTSDDDEETPQS